MHNFRVVDAANARSTLRTSKNCVMPLEPQVTFLGLPARVLAGEVIRCTAQLKNEGSSVLTSRRMLSSHPELYCLPTQQLLDCKMSSITGV